MEIVLGHVFAKWARQVAIIEYWVEAVLDEVLLQRCRVDDRDDIGPCTLAAVDCLTSFGV